MNEILSCISEAQSQVNLLTKLTEDPDPETGCAFDSEGIDNPWHRALIEMSSGFESHYSSDESSLNFEETLITKTKTETELNPNTTMTTVAIASKGAYSDDANPNVEMVLQRQLKREYGEHLAKKRLFEAEKDLEKYMKAYETLVVTK